MIENGIGEAVGSFEFRLNGQPVRVDGISPNVTLLNFLRAPVPEAITASAGRPVRA